MNQVHCPHCDAATRAAPEALHMEAGVSLGGEPFIHLAWRKERVQLTPQETREHALLLLEIAQAAEYEAAFSRWAQAKLGMTLGQTAGLLSELREYFAVAEEQPLGRSRHE